MNVTAFPGNKSTITLPGDILRGDTAGYSLLFGTAEAAGGPASPGHAVIKEDLAITSEPSGFSSFRIWFTAIVGETRGTKERRRAGTPRG
jgi:hypothetical protein